MQECDSVFLILHKIKDAVGVSTDSFRSPEQVCEDAVR